ncbi:Fur-regulated basic protein FbpA [Parageobacillus thermoglucosidasius]|uniref:Fur-regulated basic protein FbpA n=1 Tax=Geobacillus sp. (strain Y4.1MC1) TaxID=581103 RepID=A0A7U4DKV7_GEOS0|nr:Fur-regulated basic protein FbpA [Parageobacillus thermoglucosidasius]MED4904810.1 Fur-regulated basic protein FbpA [Parageobacillus thermoglucosidasius]MED4913627.1 Fur-regulated basic protein FbpA [Parageobacillus thermoglucosidasius]MED4944977.1 Fur-regulated basic protein FbpA [Parageobacillus thermoglucosidasius]MED4983414.1 Fur-regulated basic protein FbpA [Parageobacillus thermoglucosidasius]
MGKLLRTAITKQKQFYIYKLLQTGLFPDASVLQQWTVRELRHEYEQHPLQKNRGGRRNGSESF